MSREGGDGIGPTPAMSTRVVGHPALTVAGPDADGPTLSADGLTVGYGGTPVVQDVSVCARPGKLTAIVGPNGAGKSTLLKGMAGVLRCSSGRMRLGDDDVTNLSPERLIRRVRVPTVTSAADGGQRHARSRGRPHSSQHREPPGGAGLPPRTLPIHIPSPARRP